jgi:hypothetical protein
MRARWKEASGARRHFSPASQSSLAAAQGPPIWAHGMIDIDLRTKIVRIITANMPAKVVSDA